MDSNMKFWQKSAKLYTHIQEKKNGRMYEEIASMCERYISGKTVLELACGTGQLTAPLAQKADLWEATDFSQNMVKYAAERNIPCASFSVQDACNLPYAKSSFDVIIISNALHIMPEPQKAMAEIKRVLKPHGILLAPNFVYAGKANKLHLFLVNAFGFKTFNKWSEEEYISFIESFSFNILKTELIDGDPLPNLFLAAQNME